MKCSRWLSLTSENGRGSCDCFRETRFDFCHMLSHFWNGWLQKRREVIRDSNNDQRKNWTRGPTTLGPTAVHYCVRWNSEALVKLSDVPPVQSGKSSGLRICQPLCLQRTLTYQLKDPPIPLICTAAFNYAHVQVLGSRFTVCLKSEKACATILAQVKQTKALGTHAKKGSYFGDR